MLGNDKYSDSVFLGSQQVVHGAKRRPLRKISATVVNCPSAVFCLTWLHGLTFSNELKPDNDWTGQLTAQDSFYETTRRSSLQLFRSFDNSHSQNTADGSAAVGKAIPRQHVRGAMGRIRGSRDVSLSSGSGLCLCQCLLSSACVLNQGAGKE